MKTSSTPDFAVPLVDLLVFSGLCKSKSEAKRDILAGSIYVNNVKVGLDKPTPDSNCPESLGPSVPMRL